MTFIPNRRFAVIRRDSVFRIPLGRCLRPAIGKALDKMGILHNWISEDCRAKRSHDVTTASVKGFDYACVFLLGMEWLDPGRWTEAQIIKLAYVAVTRARERLFIPYSASNNLIRKIIKWKDCQIWFWCCKFWGYVWAFPKESCYKNKFPENVDFNK